MEKGTMVAVFLMAFYGARCENCSIILSTEGHPPICCPFCEHGMFIVKNCSFDGIVYWGITCEPCADCTGEGMRTVSACTPFSDAQCECTKGYTMSMSGKRHCLKDPTLVILVIMILILTLTFVLAAMLCCHCGVCKPGALRKIPMVV